MIDLTLAKPVAKPIKIISDRASLKQHDYEISTTSASPTIHPQVKSEDSLYKRIIMESIHTSSNKLQLEPLSNMNRPFTTHSYMRSDSTRLQSRLSSRHSNSRNGPRLRLTSCSSSGASYSFEKPSTPSIVNMNSQYDIVDDRGLPSQIDFMNAADSRPKTALLHNLIWLHKIIDASGFDDGLDNAEPIKQTDDATAPQKMVSLRIATPRSPQKKAINIMKAKIPTIIMEPNLSEPLDIKELVCAAPADPPPNLKSKQKSSFWTMDERALFKECTITKIYKTATPRPDTTSSGPESYLQAVRSDSSILAQPLQAPSIPVQDQRKHSHQIDLKYRRMGTSYIFPSTGWDLQETAQATVTREKTAVITKCSTDYVPEGKIVFAKVIHDHRLPSIVLNESAPKDKDGQMMMAKGQNIFEKSNKAKKAIEIEIPFDIVVNGSQFAIELERRMTIFQAHVRGRQQRKKYMQHRNSIIVAQR
jgi:hypothetical protein